MEKKACKWRTNWLVKLLWMKKGKICHRQSCSMMFHWEPEGRYHIVPFWFSMEHHWIVTMPFWLSTDDVYRKLVCGSDIHFVCKATCHKILTRWRWFDFAITCISHVIIVLKIFVNIWETVSMSLSNCYHSHIDEVTDGVFRNVQRPTPFRL